MDEVSNSDKNAQFHWTEGNKFALEFCKSLFLYNSTISASLIAYTASTSKDHINQINIHQKTSIFLFLVAAALAILAFSIGYIINLRHGNSYKKTRDGESQEIWNSANRLQVFLYIYFLIVLAVMATGLYEIYNAFA